MKLQYRAAAAADAQECVRIRAHTRENAISEKQLAELGITPRSWAMGIDSGELPGFVCVANACVVGYCFGSSKTGEVVVLALLPAFENLGIGKQLLGLVVASLMAAGHQRLFLACSPDPTVRSYGFYRQLGWRSTDAFDDHGDEILALVRPEASVSGV